MVLWLRVKTQIVPTNEGCGMDFFLFLEMDHENLDSKPGMGNDTKILSDFRKPITYVASDILDWKKSIL
jgi:hypothetical protein